jgi:hypothetical protein
MATCLAPRHLCAPATGSRLHCSGSKLGSYTKPFSSSVNRNRRPQTVRMARTESQQSEIGTPAPDFQVRNAWRHARSPSICTSMLSIACKGSGGTHSQMTGAWHQSRSYQTWPVGSRTHHWTMWQRDRRRYWFCGSATTAPLCWRSSVRCCFEADVRRRHAHNPRVALQAI